MTRLSSFCGIAVAAMLIAALGILPVQAQLEYRSVAEGGQPRAAEVLGTTLFLGQSNLLAGYDVSNPSAPVRVVSLPLPGVIEKIAIDAGRSLLYAAARDAGVVVFDISNPAMPVEVLVINTPGSALGVTFHNNLLFIADGSAGLRVLDVTNPAAPTFVSALPSTGFINDIAVQTNGNYVYVSGTDFVLQNVKVSIPTAPVVFGTYAGGTFGSASVAMTGNTAYTGSSSIFGVSTLDVTDRSNPVVLGGYGLATNVVSLTLDGPRMYSCQNFGILILDITPPDGRFVELARLGNPGESGLDVAVSGNVLFTGMRGAGLDVYDVSVPAAPVMLHDGFADWGGAQDALVEGGYAYVAVGTGILNIVDVSNPDAIAQVTHFDPVPVASAVSIAKDGNTVFIGTPANTYNPPSVQIVDVANPMAPVHLGSYNDASAPDIGVMAAADGALYVARTGGVREYDVSTPATPLALYFLSEASPITRIHAVPSRLYVLSMAGLRIIDSSSFLHELGSYTTPGTASGMWIDEARSRAYIADTGNGLVILDIADPTTPVLLGTYTALPGASDVSGSGNFAFVADGTAGVHLIDVFDPAAPSDLGQFDRPSGGRLRTLANGNDALVLDENAGLISLRNLAAATAVGDDSPTLPAALEQNSPNPFNPTTSIRYRVARAGHVSIVVYDAQGRAVRRLVDEIQDTSREHVIRFDGRDAAGRVLSSGVYFYRLVAPGIVQTRKMVLLK